MKHNSMSKKSGFLFFILLTSSFLLFPSTAVIKSPLVFSTDPNVESSLEFTASTSLQTTFPRLQVFNDILTLQTANLMLKFDLTTYGSLTYMKNLLTNQQVTFHTTNHPFWRIELLEHSSIGPSDAIYFDYTYTQTSTLLYYQFSIDGDLLEVFLTIQLDSPHVGINFKLETIGPPTLPGIYQVYLPIIDDISRWALIPGAEELAVPEREGWLIKDAINTLNSHWFGRDYPGTLSMQFLVLEEPEVGGFVLSARDSASRHKGITLHSGVHIDFHHYSNNMVFNHGNNFTMDYWMVLNGYQGMNWAAGASQYKDWARDQWYIDKGPIHSRNDIPTWLKTIDYVWKGSSYVTDHNTGNFVLEGETVDNMGLFPNHLTQKGLSSDFLLEWWGWGRDGFDRGYPEYYPARDGNDKLVTGINAVHTASSKVMLYFNGRLVDITTETYAQNLPYMTGWRDTVYTETYTPYLTGAIADPASDWWQETVLNLSVTAVRDFQVDLLYLDQISVAPPMFDYRDVPSHPPGSGSWWQVAENQLLNRTRNAIHVINPATGLASENVIETYLNTIDLFWSYHTSYQPGNWFPTGKSIPLFSYVYHPYLLTSGRPDINPVDFTLFFWGLSESLKDGFIPGAATLISPSWLSVSSKSYDALIAAYSTRKLDNYQFFRDGDLLYPVSWSNSPQITLPAYPGTFNVPQGVIQGYQSPLSSIALLFVNRGNSDLTWSGNFSQLLLDSGIASSQIRTIEDIVTVNNGIETSISPFPSTNIDLHIPAYSFITFLMNSSFLTTSLPTITLTSSPPSSTTLISTTSHKSPSISLSLFILILLLVSIVHKKKSE